MSSYRVSILSIVLALGLSSSGSQWAWAEQSAPANGEDELVQARLAVEEHPDDPKLRVVYGRMLREQKRYKDAATQLTEAIELEPDYFFAYHELSQIDGEPGKLDDAIERLKILNEKNPNQLLLVIALSELYESRSRFYEAHRCLIDLVYNNAVPQKYIQQISARIRYLERKCGSSQTASKIKSSSDDAVPGNVPLPDGEESQTKPQGKVKEPDSAKSFGHTTLLP